MGTFLLDLRVGERLSYGMALALVVVAQQIATGGLIPVSNERLWIDKFIGWSFYWVVVGLVESVLVGYLYFMREDKDAKLRSDGDKNTRIYDGMQESALIIPADSSEPSTQSKNQNNAGRESHEHESELHEFDLTVPNGQASNSKSTDLESAGKEKPKQLTFKLQLQDRPVQDNENRAQTRNLSEIEQPMNRGAEGLSKYWTWMYTISLRRMDRFFFFLTLTSYTIFLIIMFLTVPLWGKDLQDVWIDENSSPLQADQDL